MSNGTNDVSGAVTNLIDTFGKLAQQQVDVLNNAVKTAASLVDPLTKTATDLAGTLLNTCNQVLQSVSAAIAPKK
ncbi:MAG: chlorosome envelope protein B [Chlorobiaceae bacterium]|jgi:chlorosome envelope protein B|nr:chlorosome envelope protein B [Chlorobiaceae bacterium]NTV60252.1 chlorosome envelope protein B [Chlorobiaceae bacterium]